MNEKLATAEVNVKCGRQNLDLYMDGNYYGCYPLDHGEATTQVREALKDAKEYGYTGIILRESR